MKAAFMVIICMKKIYFFRTFIIVQLLIILLSITHIEENLSSKSPICELFFNLYSTVTYSVVSYSFFAPEVKPGYEFEFLLDGKMLTLKQRGFPEANSEIQNMLHTTKSFFDVDSSTQLLCTRSFGVKMLNQYQKLFDKVSIVVYRDSIPTYKDYLKNPKIKWIPHYQTTIIANE